MYRLHSFLVFIHCVDSACEQVALLSILPVTKFKYFLLIELNRIAIEIRYRKIIMMKDEKRRKKENCKTLLSTDIGTPIGNRKLEN